MTITGLEMERSARRWRLALWAMGLLCVLKLVLNSHDEIVVFGADDYGYAYTAAGWYWGRDYGKYTHSRQPVFPLAITLSSVLGLPWRLMLEMVVMACGLAAARAVRACGMAAVVCVLVFASVVFHPMLMSMEHRFIVDSFYAPIMLACVLSSAAAVCSERRRSRAWWGLTAGLTGALAANTRPESVLVYGALAVAGVLAVLRWRRSADAGREILATLGAAAVLPAMITFGVTQGFALANKADMGVAVTYDLQMPGFKSVYRELTAMPRENSRIDNPVPTAVLERAFEASPTLARLKEPFTSNPAVLGYQKACENATGMKGEYGIWFFWALRHAAWVSNGEKWTSGAELDSFYMRAAQELKEAATAGKWTRRKVVVDFIPPDYGQLLQRLPGSAAECAGLLLRPVHYTRARPEKLDAFADQLFDATALRRGALVGLPVEPAKATGEPINRWHRRAIVARLDGIKTWWALRMPVIGWGAIVLGVAGMAATITLRRKRMMPAGWWVVMMSAAAAIGARLALIMLLGATGMPPMSRYMLLGSMLMVVAGAVGLGALATSVRSLLRSETRADEQPVLEAGGVRERVVFTPPVRDTTPPSA